MTSLTGEVALALAPSIRVMFSWGVSTGDDSGASMSIGVEDIVAKLWWCWRRKSQCRFPSGWKAACESCRNRLQGRADSTAGVQCSGCCLMATPHGEPTETTGAVFPKSFQSWGNVAIEEIEWRCCGVFLPGVQDLRQRQLRDRYYTCWIQVGSLHFHLAAVALPTASISGLTLLCWRFQALGRT